MELTSNGEKPILSNTPKKDVGDLKRGNKCYKNQKVQQNKGERRCQGWENGQGV